MKFIFLCTYKIKLQQKHCCQLAAATTITTELTSVIGLCFVCIFLCFFYFFFLGAPYDRSLTSHCDFWTALARQQQKAFLVIVAVDLAVLHM